MKKIAGSRGMILPGILTGFPKRSTVLASALNNSWASEEDWGQPGQVPGFFISSSNCIKTGSLSYCSLAKALQVIEDGSEAACRDAVKRI